VDESEREPEAKVPVRPIGRYERRPVAVAPWNPRAAEVADRVIAIIEARRPDLHVEHIGSTAVPNLPGKGIIDLATETEAEAIRGIVDAMYELGFGPQPGPDPWPPSRPMLVGSYALDGLEYRIHFHVQPVGGDYALDLEFRDALRNDPALAAEYARVKGEISDAAVGPLDGVVYQDAKGGWIVETYDRLGIRRPKPSAARRQEVGS
jgi:dephospho-CoA kinase